MLAHEDIVKIFTYLNDVLDIGLPAAFEQVSEFLSYISTSEYNLMAELFKKSTKLICILISESQCDRATIQGYLCVWSKFMDRFTIGEIGYELATALILLLSSLSNSNGSNDKIVRILVVSLIHSFFNIIGINPQFIASATSTVSASSTKGELASFVLHKYLSPAIGLGYALSSESAQTIAHSSAPSDPIETEEISEMDTVGEELVETESDWQDTDSTPSSTNHTIRSGPPTGALENLFKIDSAIGPVEESKQNELDNKARDHQTGSNSSIITLILRYVSHAPQLNFNQLLQIKKIAENLISSPKTVSKCSVILYNNISELTDVQFWSLVDVDGSHDLNFAYSNLALNVSLVSQRAFYSIQNGNTKWFVPFILDNLEKLSCSSEIDRYIRIFMQLVVLMLEYVPEIDRTLILSSLFLNLCTSVACSVINTLWLFNLLNVLLSKTPTNFQSTILKEFVDLREDWTEPGRNFIEITGQLPLQPITCIISSDYNQTDEDKITALKEGVGDEIFEMFNLVVDEVFRRADSDSLISAIVIITRITSKLKPISPTPLLKILCQLNEDEEDELGQMQFLFSMIRERLELALRDCSEHNLLLLSFCMSEIVKIAYKLVITASTCEQDRDNLDKLIDFLVHTLAAMLVLYENVFLNLSELSDTQKIFIPISKSVTDLIAVANFNTGIFALGDEHTTPDGRNGLERLFEMISQYSGDGQAYANRIFQSYFSVFFISCNTREKIVNAEQLEHGVDNGESSVKISFFSPSQQNELLKSSLILDSSTIFDEFLPLRLFLKDFATEEVRKKKGEIFLVKRIISIMQKILDKSHLLSSTDIFKNMEKCVVTLCNLAIFQTALIDELTDAEKITLIDFSFQKHGNVAISKTIQVPVFNCLLEHQSEIMKEKKDMLDGEKLMELFSSVTCWLSDNYVKKSEGSTSGEQTVKLLKMLTTSILNKELIEIGLARLVFDNKDEDFISLFEYLVTIANALDKDNAILGHQKVIQVTKIFLSDLASKPTDQLKKIVESKKLLALLSYITQLGLHLDVNKREPSADLMNTETADLNSELNDKLCTYTTTQREFQNQHWYHCYTCEMFDSVGVCSVCAKVCHAGHQLSYAKNSSFFCDCGAQEQGTCAALTKRTAYKSPLTSPTEGTVNFEIRLSTSEVKQLCTDVLVECAPLLEKIITSLCENNAENSSKQNQGYQKAQNLLSTFKNTTGRQVTSESFSRAEFQTNEGALENVKPTFTGEAGNQIRKILTENVIQRNYVGLLHDGKEKFLLVLHDKNKLSLLALSSLLSKKSRGATTAVSRQSSTTMSFPIMSVAVSPTASNVVVCSTREVCVLLIDAGSFGRQISLNLNLSPSQYITRIHWAPNSSVIVAVSTNENVKIFDLSKDVISPVYNFKPVTGVLTDFTFLYHKKTLCLVVINNEGTIYIQQLGPDFYNNNCYIESYP